MANLEFINRSTPEQLIPIGIDTEHVKRELSGIALSKSVELKSDKSEFENRRVELGIASWVDYPMASYPIDGQEKHADRVESEIDRRISDSMIGYLEGEAALRDLGDPRLKRYIDSDEVEFLLDSQNEPNVTQKDKDFYLMQIHNRILERFDTRHLPKNIADRQTFSELRHVIKTDYIMNMNESISDYVDSVSQKKGNNLSVILEGIRTISLKNVNVHELRKNTTNLTYLNDYFQDNSRIMRGINSLIEGMRHEAGFKEIISEIPEDVIEIIDTDREQDSHGVDMILRVKVSNEYDNKGNYKLASDFEIENGEYEEKDLPLDIKSSKRRADEALDKILNNDQIEHWVMWSHINDDDFRLGKEKGSKKVEIVCSRENAPVYLDYSVQIEALKYLREGESVEDYKAFNDSTDRYDYAKPDTLKTRLAAIKDEIIRGINSIYNDKA